MPATWNGVLNKNRIFLTIANMLISQEVEANNIGSGYSSLASRAKVDGTLYGDTKLYYFTDASETNEYTPDTVQQLNLLETMRPKDPFVDSVTIDKFRWCGLTTDEYLTKQAFTDETVFSSWQSVCKQWLRDNMAIHMNTTYNAFVGTDETTEGKQEVIVDLTGITEPVTTTDEEAFNRLVAEKLATALADLAADMKDYSTDYNDLGYLRTFDMSEMEVIWNADWVNLIRKTMLPTVFHKDGLIAIKEENILPAKYFGTVNSGVKVADSATRSLIEQRITGTDDVSRHYWAANTIKTGDSAPAGTSYQTTPAVMQNGSIICKLVHKKAIPFMAGFETTGEFYNPKNRSTNTYVHFGYNTLKHIAGYPVITVKASA